MIKLTTGLLVLGTGMVIATTAIAQGQSGCWWVGCNPEATLCRTQCGSDNVLSQWYQWQAPYAYAYARQRSHHRHTKHHKDGNSSG